MQCMQMYDNMQCMLRTKVSPLIQDAASIEHVADPAASDETHEQMAEGNVAHETGQLTSDQPGQRTQADEAMDIDIASASLAHEQDSEAEATQPLSESQQEAPATAQLPSHDIRSKAAATQLKQTRNRTIRLTSLPHALRFPVRKQIPRSLEFTKTADIKAALSNAWSREADPGIQAAVLYELFGDSMLPHVPLLPLLSNFC